MEYDEENISQEELDRENQNPDTEEETPEEVTEAEEMTESPKNQPMAKKPRGAGLTLTIFGAILIVLIGGLASYYYYTFQKNGQSNEKVLTNVWEETVLTTINLTTRFDQITDFVQLGESGADDFDSYVSDANRTVRDGIFDVRSQTALDATAGTFASKLNSFLDDYSNMLGELKRIASRTDEIADVNDLKELTNYSDDMESSYDDLILVGNKYIQANLPRAIFEMSDEILTMLEAKLEEEGTLETQEKENRQAAEQVTTQFVEAWKDRDPDAMAALMTNGAKNEFNRGILEDSSEITSFRIMNTKADSESSIMISGKIDKETPDNQKVSEDWEFTLIKTGDKWLIDSWKQV